MKKAIVLILLLFLVFPCFSDTKRKVAVYALSNPNGEKWISTLGKSVTDTVVLSLALMGRYDIEKPESEESNFNSVDIGSFAESKGFDNIIFGDCLLTEEGYKVTVSIYDLGTDSIKGKAVEEFTSLLDSFDAADNIVDVLVEELSGEKVYYGSVELSTSENEDYRTEVNGVDVGRGFSGSDKVITGKHSFSLYQERMSGEELVYSEEIEVAMRKKSVIKAEIPWLTGKEAVELRKIQDQLFKGYFRQDREIKSDEYFNYADSFTENSFIKENRAEIINYFTELKSIYNDKADYNNLKKCIPESNTRIYEKIFDNSLHRKSNMLSETSIPAKAGLFSKRFSNLYPVCSYDAEIEIDGKSDDWKNITSIYEDMKNDAKIKNRTDDKGSNIHRIGAAVNKDFLYLMFDAAGSSYRNDCRYSVYISNNDVLRVSYYPGGRMTEVTVAPGKVWNSSYNIKVPVKKAEGEILEIALPMSVINKYLSTDSYVTVMDFTVKNRDNSDEILDSKEVRFIVPTLYYALSADKTAE